MDLFTSLHRRTLHLLGRLSAEGLLSPAIDLGRSAIAPSPVGARHDLVLDAALVHARDVVADGAGPAWLARILVAEASAWPEVDAADAVGPGFVAVVLRPAARFVVVADILRSGAPGRTGEPMDPGPPVVAGTSSLARARSTVLADVASRLAAASGSVRPMLTGEGDAPTCGPVVVVSHGDADGALGRPGAAPTYAAVVAAVGPDAFRVAAVSRRPDATLRLDLAALGERARSNSAFWLPYVHARSRRLLRRVAPAFPELVRSPARLAEADLGALTGADDLALVRLLVLHGHVVARAVSAGLPHLFQAQLRALADAVHRQWSGSKDQPQLRFVNEQRRYSTEARLALVTASTLVLETGLGILGVAAPDEMP